MKALKSTLASTLAFASLAAQAHEGHGHAGSHWHATDALGFVLVGLVALAFWISRK